MAIIAAVAYGLIPVLSKLILQTGLNSITILCYRHFICVVFLLIICTIRKQKTAVSPTVCLKWIGLGALVYAVQAVFYMFSLERIDASITTMLISTYPIFVPILMVILGHERVDPLIFICSTAAITGLWLLLGNINGIRLNSGILLGLGTGFIYAFYIFLGSQIDSNGIDSLSKTLCVLFGALIGFTIYGSITQTIDLNLSSYTIVVLTIMALICNVLSMVCFWKAVSIIGAARSSLIGILEPVTSIILTVLVLRESLTLRQCFGIVVILISVGAVQFIDNQA